MKLYGVILLSNIQVKFDTCKIKFPTEDISDKSRNMARFKPLEYGPKNLRNLHVQKWRYTEAKKKGYALYY